MNLFYRIRQKIARKKSEEFGVKNGDREAGEESGCHPERSGLAAEPKDLPAEMTAALNEARRSFDSCCSLRMTSRRGRRPRRPAEYGTVPTGRRGRRPLRWVKMESIVTAQILRIS